MKRTQRKEVLAIVDKLPKESFDVLLQLSEKLSATDKPQSPREQYVTWLTAKLPTWERDGWDDEQLAEVLGKGFGAGQDGFTALICVARDQIRASERRKTAAAQKQQPSLEQTQPGPVQASEGTTKGQARKKAAKPAAGTSHGEDQSDAQSHH